MSAKLPLLFGFVLGAAGCLRQADNAPPPVDEGEPAPVASSPEARAIIEKAIAAQGGEAAVAKLLSMRIKVEGTARIQSGQPAMPLRIEDIWQMPHRYRTSSVVMLKGMEFKQIHVIDGDQGFIVVNGARQEMSRAALTEFKEQKYGEDFDRLGFLNDKTLTLSVMTEAVFEGVPAIGVRIDSPGHRPVTLYFDKKTNLLLKRVHPVLDQASGMEITQEVLFSDYQKTDGVLHYRKIMGKRNGEVYFEGKVTEIEFLPKIDDSVFTMP